MLPLALALLLTTGTPDAVHANFLAAAVLPVRAAQTASPQLVPPAELTNGALKTKRDQARARDEFLQTVVDVFRRAGSQHAGRRC